MTEKQNVKTVPTRKEISEKDKWDLTSMFEDDKAWEKLFSDVEKELSGYKDFKGNLGKSVDFFKSALDFHMSVSRRFEKLYVYTHLQNDSDKSNKFYEGMHQRSKNLLTQLQECSSFMDPEIQALPADVAKKFTEDKSLKEYNFYLEKILRYKPHTRSESEEKLLSMSSKMAQAASSIFGQLDNVDMKFGEIKNEKGETLELSHGNFTTFLTSADQEIRKNAFLQYYKEYEGHKHTYAATLLGSLEKDVFYAKAKNFKSCREASMFRDNVPESVYDNLVSTVKNNLGPLFKYFNFRKSVLGVPELHHYDTYVPMVSEVDFNMPFDQAVDICIKSVAPLGREYQDILKKGLKSRWVDKFESRGKRSGAFSSGCYDSPPYILMNYESGNLNSLYTLLHEAGHSLHSYYSKISQPYVDHDYTIFVAEVASTVNEALLSHFLLDYYKDNPEMKVYILNREIDNFKATFYRQTMFAEFELITHTIVENNQPLTLEEIRGIYRKLLETYFGDTTVIDKDLELECLRIPHFYSAFYVYKYATGVSAAVALANKILKGGKKAVKAYLDFLNLGGSKFPLDSLKVAGVDMSKPDPIESAAKYFEDLVDRFILEYKKL